VRKQNNQPRKQDILKLRKEGRTYKEIQDELGCSKSVISYHCGEGKTEQKRVKKRNASEDHKLSRKVSAFKCRASKDLFRGKLKTFKRRNPKNRTHTIVNNLSKNFTTQDVLDKFGKNPACYLTGTPIDLSKPETYHFDHIIPASKGGTNDLSNLQICLKEANNAKSDLSLKDLYDLCEKILKHKNSA
jgi:5-methylcytosine-specific restriction endonuclease McrA